MKVGTLVRFNRFSHETWHGKIGMIVDIKLSCWAGKEPEPALTSYKLLVGNEYVWVNAREIEKIGV